MLIPKDPKDGFPSSPNNFLHVRTNFLQKMTKNEYYALKFSKLSCHGFFLSREEKTLRGEEGQRYQSTKVVREK